MIIDVNKIKALGKTEEEFSFEYFPTRKLLSLPSARVEKVKVWGVVRLSGKKAEVEGNILYTIEGECSRCLEEARVETEEKFEAEYSALEGAERPIKAGCIDLVGPVEEAVITSSPQVIYCKEDCKGLCPVCGANLNGGPCSCKI